MARVEFVGCLVDGQDVDVAWELLVDTQTQRRRGHVGIKLEVRYLRERVHAGIGAAGAIELELAPPAHLADRPIQFALDRSRVRLYLPSTVPAAGVFDGELESRHDQRVSILHNSIALLAMAVS